MRVGEGNLLELFIRLTNTAEDAHEATLTLELPSNVHYRGINSLGKDYSCVPLGNRVMCHVGNPLRQHQLVEFSIRLELEGVHASMDKLKFMLWMNT